MHTPSLALYASCLERGDWPGVGWSSRSASARKLERVGADFLICPDNTFHQALAHIASRSPLPWLHIADSVVDEAAARGTSDGSASIGRVGSSRAKSTRKS